VIAYVVSLSIFVVVHHFIVDDALYMLECLQDRTAVPFSSPDIVYLAASGIFYERMLKP